MPQIIITTSGPGEDKAIEVHRERVQPVDVESDTSSHLLVERIAWALSDAEELESREPEEATAPFTRREGGIGDGRVL